MKILTLTLHYIDNCGSCLQAYALQQFLLKNGYDTELIDYRPQYLINNGRPLKHFIKKIVFGTKLKNRWKVFDEFLGYYKLTDKTYTKYSQLKKNPPKADAYIVGSDQVWNRSFPCGRDEAYYLDFVEEGKKLSYAASLGKESTPQAELEEIKSRIGKFDFVSVREDVSVKELQSVGCGEVTWVCDPVLLHDKSFYEELAVRTEVEKYALVYLIPQSELLDKLIQYLRKEKGYKIVYVGSFLNRCDCDVNYTDVGPKEFLGLIKDAEFIVAGSFHATVFSHIFQKDFVTLAYQNNARMIQFLELTGLTDRYLQSEDAIVKVMDRIDYRIPLQNLERFRDKSAKCLLNVLENMESKRDTV